MVISKNKSTAYFTRYEYAKCPNAEIKYKKHGYVLSWASDARLPNINLLNQLLSKVAKRKTQTHLQNLNNNSLSSHLRCFNHRDELKHRKKKEKEERKNWFRFRGFGCVALAWRGGAWRWQRLRINWNNDYCRSCGGEFGRCDSSLKRQENGFILLFLRAKRVGEKRGDI